MVCADREPAEAKLQQLRHRFRNSLQVINSLVGLHGRGIKDPAASVVFADLQARLTVIARIFVELDAEDAAGVDLQDFLPRIGHHVANLYEAGSGAELRFDLIPIWLEGSRAALVGQILAEILIDLYRRPIHGPGIDIVLSERDDSVVLEVRGGAAAEDGPATGLSPAIIKSLVSTLGATLEPATDEVRMTRLSFTARSQ